MNKLFIGTSGYIYKDWKKNFYPLGLAQKYWLNYYANFFNSVEINASFYRSFDRSIFKKWYESTPEDFSFVLKGSRFITHIKRANNVKKEVGEFFENITPLQQKLNVVLWQFPPNFKKNEITYKNLSKFLAILPSGIKQVIELRNETWFGKEIYDLLNKFNIGFVINDSVHFPSIEVVTGNIVYIRLHGPDALYSSLYTNEQLNYWAEKIKDYLNSYDVYCYFNNDVNCYAIQNAQELKALLLKLSE